MSHRLKCWAENFDAIAAGRKTCEIRSEADRTFLPGELVELTRTDRATGKPTEPRTRILVAITHVDRLAGELALYGQDEGTGLGHTPIVVLSFTQATVRL